jgi:hypothetical protein
MSITGGCQCGAVRYRIEGQLGRASICHCRMCQKAFGGPFGPLVSAKIGELVWTRGERRRFASSNKVERGFCGDCGTPLTFEYSEKWIDVSIGSLDDPSLAVPTVQLETGSRMTWTDSIPGLELVLPPEGYYETIQSRQHPDFDTDDGPPR